MNNFQQYYERMKARMAFESYYDKMKGSLILEGKSIKDAEGYPNKSSYLQNAEYKNAGDALAAYYAAVEDFIEKHGYEEEETDVDDLPEGKTKKDVDNAVKAGEENGYKWENLESALEENTDNIPQDAKEDPKKLKAWVKKNITDPEKKKVIGEIVKGEINKSIKNEIGEKGVGGWLYKVDDATGEVMAPLMTPKKQEPTRSYDEKEIAKIKTNIDKVKKKAEEWSENFGDDSKTATLLKKDQTYQRERYTELHKSDLIQKWRKEHEKDAETSAADILKKPEFTEMANKEFDETSKGKAIIQNISNQEVIDAGRAVKLKWQEEYRKVLDGDESEEEKIRILDEYDRAMKNEIAAAEHDAAVNAPGKVDWSKADPEIKALNHRKDEIEQRKKDLDAKSKILDQISGKENDNIEKHVELNQKQAKNDFQVTLKKLKNGLKPYDKLTKEQRDKLYDKYKDKEEDGTPELMDELKDDVKKVEDGEKLTALADKNKTNQDKRQEKITTEKNKAMNELLKGNFGAALKGLGTMFLLKLQDEKLTEDENEALKTAADKFGENKNVLIANMLKEQGVSDEIVKAVAKSGDLKDLTDEQKKEVAKATEKLEKPKPEEIPSEKYITRAAEEVNKEMTNAEKNVTDGEDDDETTWEDMDDEDKKKLVQDLKDGDLDDVDENELKAIYVKKEEKEPAEGLDLKQWAEDQDKGEWEDIDDEKEEDDGDEEDAEVDDGNGEKKKIVNPKKVWKRKKNKATGKTTKSYYNGKKDSKGHPISISKKEFQEKVKAYQEAKKKGVSESRTIVSFDTFIRKRLFESRKK